jgi:hypothetical protein
MSDVEKRHYAIVKKWKASEMNIYEMVDCIMFFIDNIDKNVVNNFTKITKIEKCVEDIEYANENIANLFTKTIEIQQRIGNIENRIKKIEDCLASFFAINKR